jgi:hypothetical protein
MGTEAIILAAVSVGSAVVSSAAQVSAAKAQASAASAAANLAQAQQAERSAIIQADILDKENEIIRQRNRTVASIHAQRPFQETFTGTGHIKAGIDEEIRLADSDIRSIKIQGLQQIRDGEFAVKGAQITAAGARSKVGSSILAGIGTVGKAVTKAGLSFGSTGSVGGPLTTTRGSIFDDPFDRP